MIKRKSVTQRAADAVRAKASSADLKALKAEIAERIQQVDGLRKANAQEVDTRIADGDLDELRAARQSEVDLKDEDKVLHRQQSDLHRAIEVALGEEAIAAESQHRKSLVKALEQAEKAQAMLEESRRVASAVIQARKRAAGIGQELIFDADTIRALAASIHPEGNARKQALIDLGLSAAVRRAA